MLKFAYFHHAIINFHMSILPKLLQNNNKQINDDSMSNKERYSEPSR